MIYLAFTTLILIIAILAAVYLFQVVKQAAVKPVIDGKFPVEVFSEKRRYEVIWEDWKFLIGAVLGLFIGWWL